MGTHSCLYWLRQLHSGAVLLVLSRDPYPICLGGDGGWDYIVPDPVNHRLFIARQNRVMVVDEDT
jgi:hypothetical protein